MDTLISGNSNIINLLKISVPNLSSNYKISQYNYIISKNDRYILYNSLYNTLVRLNEDEIGKYIGKLPCDENLKNKFIENAIWIEDNIDEFREYLKYANKYIKLENSTIGLTIATTLKCNARCSYCYEKGVIQKDMKLEVADKIVDFIKERKQKYVDINWFGGEPLMNKKFIDCLTDKLKSEDINFNSYMITNGSLIDDDILNNSFERWNVRNIQITIDGTKDEYEKRKNYYNYKQGEYYKILSIVKKLAEKNKYIHIRINIDKNNLKNVLELTKELELIFGKYDNVVLYPAFITGTEYKLSEEEKDEIVYNMFKIVKNPKKLTAASKLYSIPRMFSCMYNNPNAFSIDVNGRIYRCEHDLGKQDYAIGNIYEGLFEKDKRLNGVSVPQNCENCKFLPKCMGGCISNLKSGDSACMIEKYIIKAYMKSLLE